MDSIIRKNSSTTVTIGPFLDDTDFKTAEIALTIANTDVKLKKNGAANVNKNTGGATHDVNGYYHMTLNSTDTNTAGQLHYHVQMAGALAVWGYWQVLEQAAYDLYYATSSTGIPKGGIEMIKEELYPDESADRVLVVQIQNTDGTPSTAASITALSIDQEANNQGALTTYTGANIETVTTPGTYQTPTAGKVRWSVRAIPGEYELHLRPDQRSIANASKITFRITGTGIKPFTLILNTAVADMATPITEITAAKTASESANTALTAVQTMMEDDPFATGSKRLRKLAVNIGVVNDVKVKGNGTAGNEWLPDL